MAEKESRKNLLHFSGYPNGQELISECEIVHEGALDVKSAYEKCEKKSLHKKYIPVKDFNLDHLPENLRTPRIKRLIDLRCALTVRITVDYTSEYRPDKFSDSRKPYPFSECKGSRRERRFGTGIIQLQEAKSIYYYCNCLACITSKDHKQMRHFWLLKVMTSTHVIYDQDEAVHSKFDCFFDSEDETGVKTFYGVGFDKGETEIDFNLKSDLSEVICAVHDEELMKKLWSVYGSNVDALFYPLAFPPEEVIVSHPHGGSKQVSVGKIRYLTVPLEPNYETNVAFPFKVDVVCHSPLGVTPDVGENEPNLGSIRRQFIRQQEELFLSETLDQFLARLPTDEKEIAFQILYRSLISFLRMNYMFNMNVDFGISDEEPLRIFYDMINFIIIQRLHNKNHPELIDIGFLLWRCVTGYLLDYNDGFEKKDLFFGIASPEMLTLCLTWYGLNKPYLGKILDIRGYLTEISAEDTFSSRQHSSERDMQVTMIQILTGNDAVTVDHENFKMFDIFFCQIISNYSYLIRRSDIMERVKTANDPSDLDYLRPGKDSLLPGLKTTFTLPSSAKYAYRIYNGDPPFCIFPPETTFHCLVRGEKRVKLPLPDNTQFIVGLMDSNTTYYVNYSTATCGGSSGACVFLHWDTFRNSAFHVHSSGFGKSHNRSGLTFNHLGIQDVKTGFQDFFEPMNSC